MLRHFQPLTNAISLTMMNNKRRSAFFRRNSTGDIFANAYIIEIDTRNTETGSSASNQFRFRVGTGGSCNLWVSWGDGVIENFTTIPFGGIVHAYSTGGIYDVKFVGTIPNTIGTGNSGSQDRLKWLDIKQWGTDLITPTTSSWGYWSAINLKVTATDQPTNKTSINFRDCTSLTALNWAHWDMSNTTTINFYGCTALGTCDFSGWDLSNCTSVNFRSVNLTNVNLSNWIIGSTLGSGSFQQCTFASATGLDSWDITLLRNMSGFFINANLGTTNISSWDVSLVEYFNSTFSGTSMGSTSLTTWDMGSALSINNMLRSSNAFTNANPTSVAGWNVSSVVDFTQFSYITSGTVNVTSWDTSSGVDFSYFGARSNTRNQNLTLLDFSNAQIMDNFYAHNVTITTALPYDAGQFNMSNVTSAVNMFGNNTLSSAQYDAILVGWAAQSLQSGVVFSGGNSKYSPTGAAARAILTGTYGWTITDGGPV